MNTIKLKKQYVCTVCKKAITRQHQPGLVSFFNNCTLTNGCPGIMIIDPEATSTPRSEITWNQTQNVKKFKFSGQRAVTIQHNFNQPGLIEVEVFMTVLDTATAVPIEIKTADFTKTIIDPNTMVLTFAAPTSGVVIVTNSGLAVATAAPVTTAAADITLLYGDVLTIAVASTGPTPDIVNVNVSTSSVPLTANYTVQFFRHSTGGRPAQVVWRSFDTMTVNGVVYTLYSGTIPPKLMTRGTLVYLNFQPQLSVVIPLARSFKTDFTDIVPNKYVLGQELAYDAAKNNLIVDNNQLNVANSAIVKETRIPILFK